jgi:hydroxyethylthiazole kinase
MSGARHLLDEIGGIVTQVRLKKPLVHQITNYVTINDCANVTLAFGASPVMANDPDEVAEVVAKAGALVLNIGTPNTRMLNSMLLAGAQANAHHVPVILDPVGVGMTGARTAVVEQLLRQVKISVVRGNMAEIQRLTGIHCSMRGLDSLATAADASESVALAAVKLDCIIAATGVVDYISDGLRTCRIENGDEMMTRITGAGCMTTALVASCCAVEGASLAAAAAGVMVIGIAGEVAIENLLPAEGTGMFRVRLLDAVSRLDAVVVEERGRVNW